MHKVNWKFKSELEGEGIKERIFKTGADMFGGLTFLEFIEYLANRNKLVIEISVNDQIVWNKKDKWIDDFLLIKVGQLDL